MRSERASDAMIDAMRAIDAGYRAAAGITERRLYKIFHSRLHPFPLLVLGQNPGGETDGTDLSASDSFFEDWEHDYVRFRNDTRYALAQPMCKLLAASLGTNSTDALRQVPASNVLFRRSRNSATLDLNASAAAAEAKMGVDQVLRMVQPRVVLLISNTAFDLFKRFHCAAGTNLDSSTHLYASASRSV